MLKNKEELRAKIKENLDKKADAFIDNLDSTSDTDEFTIDTIEDIMTRFNKESQDIVIASVNEAIASFDESKIITKKNKNIKD
jgi:hypothetical protein